MSTRQPAVRRRAAVLLQRFVLLMPPKPIRLHSGVGLRASVVLSPEVEQPVALPVVHRHVDGTQSVFNLLQSDFVFLRHCDQAPILRRGTRLRRIPYAQLSDCVRVATIATSRQISC